MSRRQFKSQASSSRAAATTFGANFGFAGFGASSRLAYNTEPPDLSAVSDPHLVVTLKNLAKKDNNTKIKALEELQEYLGSGERQAEDGLLDSWINSFPRLSIESHRRVRQLSFTVQGKVAEIVGKRIARHMPHVAGPWLAGRYDSDRAVGRAAQASLLQTFKTDEKILTAEKTFKRPILEYCQDVIDRETTATLSDLRVVSVDDAEAKFSRVAAASILLLSYILKISPAEDGVKGDFGFDLFKNRKLWSLAAAKEAHLRRAIFVLLKTCLQIYRDLPSESAEDLAKPFLVKGLSADQFGSSLELIRTVHSVTVSIPDIWQVDTGKRRPAEIFNRFLEKGSQNGPPEYWTELRTLIQTIPKTVYPDLAAIQTLLKSLQKGIWSKSEPRANLPTAFEAFVNTTEGILDHIPLNEKQALIREMLLPLISHYIDRDIKKWPLQSQHGLAVASAAAKVAARHDALTEFWAGLYDNLINSLEDTTSETTDDQQQRICDYGARQAALEREVCAVSPALSEYFVQQDSKIIKVAIKLLVNRQGVLFAAACVASSFFLSAQVTSGSELIEEYVHDFVRSNLPKLMASPSYRYLSDMLFAVNDQTTFDQAWSESTKTALALDKACKVDIILSLLGPRDRQNSIEVALNNKALQHFVTESVEQSLRGHVGWEATAQMLSRDGVSVAQMTVGQSFEIIINSLSHDDTARSALQGLETIVHLAPRALKTYIAQNASSRLLPQLLAAEEALDPIHSTKASKLSLLIHSQLTTGTSKASIASSVKVGLHDVSHASASVDTLIGLARSLSIEDRNDTVGLLLPDRETCFDAISSFLLTRLNPLQSISNDIGSATWISIDGQEIQSDEIDYDGYGYSLALRLAIFTANICDDTDFFRALSPQQQQDVIIYVQLCAELVNDKLADDGSNGIWLSEAPEIEDEMVEIAQILSKFAGKHFSPEDVRRDVDKRVDLDDFFAEPSHLLGHAGKTLLSLARGDTPEAFHYARAFISLAGEALTTSGWGYKMGELEYAVKSFPDGKDVMYSIAVMSGLQLPLAKSTALLRACNELVSSLTSDPMQLRKLIVFNTAFRYLDHNSLPVAKQRLVFLVKALLTGAKGDGNDLALTTETYRALAHLLPQVKDVYGSHWAETLATIQKFWHRGGLLQQSSIQEDSTLTQLHASLKLYQSIRMLSRGVEANDDLVEAWEEAVPALNDSLLHILEVCRDLSESAQSRRIVAELLSRSVSELQFSGRQEPSELFGLLTAESPAIQVAAFSILHRTIPAAQEQISIDAVLEKKAAHVPDELLSIVANHRQSDDGTDSSASRTFVLTWILLFDHFRTASAKVQSDYADDVKSHVNSLLDFLSLCLGLSAGKLANVSSSDPAEFDFDHMAGIDRYMLAHIYFLTLKRFPSQARSWWISCTSRQKIIAVESWTQKNISPYVIRSVMAEASKFNWSEIDADKLHVKVNERAGEISATYDVDQETMIIRIRLPKVYPLAQVSVEGVQRVAVDEKKWQAWLVNVQGVIAFSNNSILDGLVAWHRNVNAALKGQSECAICYSMISADKQLPSKRCGTCKNLFHTTCLFKWFTSSNGSTCPLCRNTFQYG